MDTITKQRIEQEIERLERQIHHPDRGPRYDELFAARQALSWALDPQMYGPPFDTIYAPPRTVAPDAPPATSQRGDGA
jgi:hypothetical protein